MEWFKFYGKDFLIDRKINRMTVVHQLMWVKLLCFASDTKDGVVRYLDETDLALACGITGVSDLIDDVPGFFDNLVKMNMIEIGKNEITVIHYTKRQQSNLSGAERAKNYRERKKESYDRHTPSRDERHARVEKSRKEKNTNSAPLRSAGVREDAQFDTFWAAYPRKTDRKRAERAWRTHKCETHLPAILEFITAAKKTEQWMKDGKKYIPHPTSFLNGERWKDDLQSYGVGKSKILYKS